jgi:hypothetical protein
MLLAYSLLFLSPGIMLNSKLKTQNSTLFFSLLFLLLSSSPCFAQGVLANPMWRLPSLPNLPSGERIYDAGGASPDQADELDSVSRPIDAQGELKTDANGIKPNKYKIEYNANTKRILGKMENGKGAGPEDFEASESPVQTSHQPDARSSKRIERRIETCRGTSQEDLEASGSPDQTLRLPDARSFGFQYQSPTVGRLGFDTSLGNANEERQQ